MVTSQLPTIGKALVLTFALAACAQTRLASDGEAAQRTQGGLAACEYHGSHDIYERLGCLRARLEEMMLPPNSRLVSDASESARRVSNSAPQSER